MRKGSMKYIAMVFAVLMLTAGSVAYAAQTNGEGGTEAVGIAPGLKSEAAPAPGKIPAAVPSINPGKLGAVMIGEMIEARRAADAEAARLALEEQARQEKVARDADAVSRFGAWGSWLVEAGATYGQDPAELYRVMMCESTGNPMADNGTHKGLFQFHPGTWAGTPYGGADIHDGPSQIMAAAWMWSQGRQNEWTCY